MHGARVLGSIVLFQMDVAANNGIIDGILFVVYLGTPRNLFFAYHGPFWFPFPADAVYWASR